MATGSLSYDVVVVGGGAAGLAAAVAAARSGARTALVERYGFLGGMATAGMVSTVCGLYLTSCAGPPEPLNEGFADDVARRLVAGISAEQRRSWSSGSPRDWARQSFEIAKIHAYGKLPRSDASAYPHGHGEFALDAGYEADAEMIVTTQLQRAGLRLARLLNEALR